MSSTLGHFFNLKGKTALITGGAGLLGKMHAEVIAEAGGNPILADIKAGSARDIAAEISKKYKVKTLGIRADITKKEDVKNVLKGVIKSFKHIDILINNAANDPKVKAGGKDFESSRFEHFSLDQWGNDLKVGLTGAFLCSQVIGAEMARIGGGVILNISSDLGIIAPDLT